MFTKNFKIKFTSLITVIFVFISSISASACSSQDINAFLLDAGFPQELVESMSDIQKDIIYQNSVGKIIRFGGYDKQEYILNEDNEIQRIDTLQRRSGIIPVADLTISVFGTYTTNSSGKVLYSSVYPNFVWNKLVKVKNDSFSMAMYSGWEARPGERNFRLHLLNNAGDSAQYVDLNPSVSNSAGYSYKIPSSTGAMQGRYAGYAYYNIDRKSSSASKRISLHYVHDASTFCNISYSISLGYASISLSGSNSNLYYFSDNYSVSGLY